MSERDQTGRPTGSVPTGSDPAPNTRRFGSGADPNPGAGTRDPAVATTTRSHAEDVPVAERRDEPGLDDRRQADGGAATASGAAATADALDPRERDRIAHKRQREEFGGLHWGSAFFGWLVAIGVAALLTALLSAVGAAIGLTSVESAGEARSSADTIGIVGGVLLVAVLLIAYYAGGYVAGRMARFDGLRQGLGVWIIGLAVTLILAAAGALLGAEYNLLAQINLPRIPIDEGSLTTGGLVALAVIVVGTLLAAILGGKAGTHYHRKVDRAGHV